MNGQQLQRIIRQDAYMNAVTWGVFARDGLPRDDLRLGAYVVNTENPPGEHWFLLYAGVRVELYDSLGRNPKDYDIHLPCDYIDQRLQSLHSDSCGQYVLYFLYWRSRGIDMQTLLDSLTKNSEKIVQEHYAWLQSISQ